jgi:hypothetical protein
MVVLVDLRRLKPGLRTSSVRLPVSLSGRCRARYFYALMTAADEIPQAEAAATVSVCGLQSAGKDAGLTTNAGAVRGASASAGASSHLRTAGNARRMASSPTRINSSARLKSS